MLSGIHRPGLDCQVLFLDDWADTRRPERMSSAAMFSVLFGRNLASFLAVRCCPWSVIGRQGAKEGWATGGGSNGRFNAASVGYESC